MNQFRNKVLDKFIKKDDVPFLPLTVILTVVF